MVGTAMSFKDRVCPNPVKRGTPDARAVALDRRLRNTTSPASGTNVRRTLFVTGPD